MKLKKQLGMSLAEALMAMVISTIVLSAAYYIYSNFQKTFTRQINHNVIQQEARFAIHSLQLDFRMAGYRDTNATNPIQRGVYLTNEAGTEITDNSEADIIYVCYDTTNSANSIQRKIIQYEFRKAKPTDNDKSMLMKKIYNTNDCVNNSEPSEPDWLPVAANFKKFKIRRYDNNVLNFEIEMEDPGKNIIENYNGAAFMQNISFAE